MQTQSSEAVGGWKQKKRPKKRKKGKGRSVTDKEEKTADKVDMTCVDNEKVDTMADKIDMTQEVIEEAEAGRQGSCLRCSVVSEQFVMPETSSKLQARSETTPEEGVVYLFVPSTNLKEHLLVDDALVDVDKEGRFCVSVLNVEQGNKVYVDKGQVIGTLEKVENVCSVTDYLAKLPTSSNDDQIVAKGDGD